MNPFSRLPAIALLIACLSSAVSSHAQGCEQFPADCPDNGMESAQDSDVRIHNMILPQEISMQNKLREEFTAMMNDISNKTKWRVYQFLEEAGSGIMSGNAPLSFAFRRPYQCGFSFIFIVNEDSLHKWKDWYNNDLQNASNKVLDSYKQSGSNLAQDDNRQKYLDSANYYGALKEQYVKAHYEEYTKALLGNDAIGQKKYEAETKKYDNKIIDCINKTNDNTAKNYEASKSQGDDLETYRHKNTIAFRNASMLRVSLNVNDYIAIANDDDKKIVHQLAIPASTLALLVHNSSPNENEIFGQYLRSPDVALLLFGKWILKQDQYHSYHSAYYADKKNTDAVSIKKIPCDKVQTLVLHVEGAPKYIEQFLRSFNIQKLIGLVTAQ